MSAAKRAIMLVKIRPAFPLLLALGFAARSSAARGALMEPHDAGSYLMLARLHDDAKSSENH